MYLKLFILSFTLILINGCKNKLTDDAFLTKCEKTNFIETADYNETIKYCKELAKQSDWIRYEVFGKSARGLDIPVLICNKYGDFNYRNVRAKKQSVVMIQCCIHPGEPEGKDAGMMLLRDIAILKKHNSLLDSVTILFIPVFNADGLSRFGKYNRINQNGPLKGGWRTTARNLNLNRDYVKADAVEMRYWLKLYNKWLPEFLIDCHTTDGADYQYVLTYGMEINQNTDPKLAEWMKSSFLNPVNDEMKKRNLEMFPYVAFKNWHDPRSGLASWVSPAMLSGGYCAVQNRGSLLIETHMLKDYKTRVLATYELLLQSLTKLNAESSNLYDICKNADISCSELVMKNEKFPVLFEPESSSTFTEFKGFDYTIDSSILSGGNWVKFSKTPKTMKVSYFNKQKIKEQAQIPDFFIFPPEWLSVKNLLIAHGVEHTYLQNITEYNIITYKFSNIKLSANSYEGRQKVQTFDMEEFSEKRSFPKGSILVPMKQRRARLIMHMFEPKSRDALLGWGFFNSIFEQKEYAESYVMEKKAREMIAADKKLENEFNTKMSQEPDFASDPQAILNWFYNKSEYRDSLLNSYPVCKIISKKFHQHRQK